MKTKLLLTVLLSFSFYLLSSQVPQGFNYQAIARDGATGNPLSNQDIVVKVSILSDTNGFKGTGGPPVYIWEEQHSVRTNSMGVFDLVIGTKSKIQGSAATFGEINWNDVPLFVGLKITPPSSGEEIMGSSKLWSVPYAMIADSLGGPLKKLEVEGETGSSDTDPLFEVRNTLGKSVFAVYNDGVSIHVAERTAKGAKGGFSVGGFDTGGKGSQNYLFADPFGVNVYVDPTDDGGKSPKGGFSVGGFEAGGKGSQNYLYADAVGVNVYIDDNPAGKTSKGGFSVGGFEEGKGDKYLDVKYETTKILTGSSDQGFGVGSLTTGLTGNYLKLTSENYFIGHNSGTLTTGKFNSFLGYETGTASSTGEKNVFIGYQSGQKNITGSENVFLGYRSGYNNLYGQANVFLGKGAGTSNTYGGTNVFIGQDAGNNNTIGQSNVFIGYNAGFNNNSTVGTEASYNIFIGHRAGETNTVGKSNVILGNGAGMLSTDGDENIIIGNNAGQKTNGKWNVYIGNASGRLNESMDNNTYVGYRTGFNDVDGTVNSFYGSFSGEEITTGDYNSFYGSMSGQKTTTAWQNSFFGYNSGNGNTTGTFNSFFGNGSGEFNDVGRNNAFFGYQSGSKNNDGNYNTNIGNGTGLNNNSGFYNTALGASAGKGNETTAAYSNNVLVGYMSGYTLTTGSGNVFIGYKAGYNVTDANDKLYIDNSDTDSPLIYGDFTDGSEKIVLNGNVGIGNSPSYNLDVTGTIRASGKLISSVNGDAFLQGGDDTELHDVNVENTLAIYGIQNSGKATLRLGNSTADISGYNGNIGIGTTAPEHKLDVAGTANIRDFFILGSGTIAVTTGTPVTPSCSNILLTATTPSTLTLANGTTVGQMLILRGSDDTNSITIPQGGNVNLPALTRVLHLHDTITLMWDGTTWIQMAFADNSAL